jgi:RNA polymerase sigma-70 factor (ECF subfamily)
VHEASAIERCKAGNRDAFRFLVHQYQAEALGHAAALLGNREDARDAVQDAFVDAWGAMRRFDSGRPFYPWFYAILRNRCLKQLAGRKKQDTVVLREAVLLDTAGGLDPDEAIALEQALHRVPAEDRELLMLRHIDGLAYDEIAERLTIPLGTVMSRLFYARRKLRSALDPARKEHA